MDSKTRQDNENHLMTMHVLELVNDGRMTNGLRHQDYRRYREYCTRRVHRLRQILHLSQKNDNKQNVRKEFPATFNDTRYFELLIYDTERAWAYAMELKQEQLNSDRKRYHLVKRLKRAAQYAATLNKHCKAQAIDDRSILEFKAYSATMEGYRSFEQEEWQIALNGFAEARTVYTHFAEAAITPQQEHMYLSTVGDMDTHIRYCARKLDQPNLTSMTAVDTIVADLKKRSTGLELLEAQLAKMTNESLKHRAKSLTQITWRDQTFSIRSDDVAQAIAKAQDNAESKESLEQFDVIISSWSHADKLVKKAIKDNKEAAAKVNATTVAQSTTDLELVYAFVTYNMYSQSIRRHLYLVQQLGDDKVREKIKLYDDICKHIEYIRNDLTSVDKVHLVETELEVLENYFSSLRCVFIAQTYVNVGKAAEALALYQRAKTYLVLPKQVLRKNALKDTVVTISNDDVIGLEKSLASSNWKSRASWYLGQNDKEDNHGSEAVSHAASEPALIDQLDQYSSTLPSPPHLIDMPPRFQAMPSKPFYFDLAANYIRYPESLSERAAGKSSGLWKFFGFGN